MTSDGICSSWTSVRSRTGCGPVRVPVVHVGITKPVRCWVITPVGGYPNGPVGFPVLLGFRTGDWYERDWSAMTGRGWESDGRAYRSAT